MHSQGYRGYREYRDAILFQLAMVTVLACLERVQWDTGCCYRELVVLANSLDPGEKVSEVDPAASQDPTQWSDPLNTGYLKMLETGARVSADQT